MMLRVIGTGSSGNCILLEADRDALLLDAGLRWETILGSLPSGLRNVRGCLITHEHKDHSKAALRMLQYGVPTVMSKGTWRTVAKNPETLPSHLMLVAGGQALYLPPFTIVAAPAMHDAAEPLAFMVRHDPTKETALYATDTYMLPNTFPGIHHWIIECNYTMSKAQELLETPEKAPLYDRLMQSHMSLERLCKAFEANDLRATRTIVLIHISGERGDSPLMQDTIERLTGIRTIAAKNGMEIKLGSCPF